MRPEIPPISMRAGAGRDTISLPEALFPIEGFTRIRDELELRVILLETAVGERIAFVVADQTSLPGDALDRLREIVAAECGLPGSRILISVSHTFSAPHISSAGTRQGAAASSNEALIVAIQSAARSAARGAVASLRPATLASGEGFCDINVNRDVLTGAGWWLGANDLAPSPKEVPVIALRDEAGRLIAVLFSAAVQPSVINGSEDEHGGRAVSADLAGAAARYLERAHPGSVAAFLVGGAADQAPRFTAVRVVVGPEGDLVEHDAGPTAEVLLELLGERLGSEVARVAASIGPGDPNPMIALARDRVGVVGQLAPPREQLRPSLSYDFETTGPIVTPVVAVRLGDAVLAGVVPEITGATSTQVRANSPFTVTAVLSMVDGADKYMADADSFDRITYEAMSSRYARGSAETVRDRLLEILGRLAEE